MKNKSRGVLMDSNNGIIPVFFSPGIFSQLKDFTNDAEGRNLPTWPSYIADRGTRAQGEILSFSGSTLHGAL